MTIDQIESEMQRTKDLKQARLDAKAVNKTKRDELDADDAEHDKAIAACDEDIADMETAKEKLQAVVNRRAEQEPDRIETGIVVGGASDNTGKGSFWNRA